MKFLYINFVVSLWLTALTTFSLGVFVLVKNYRNIINKTFAFYSFSIAWWSFCQVWLIACDKRVTALIWTRIEQIGVFLIPTFFVHFVISLLDIKHKKWLLRIAYSISIVFAILCFTRHMMADAVPKPTVLYVKYFATAGVAYHFAMLFFAIMVTYGLSKLYIAYQLSTGAKQNQLKYLFWSSLLGYIGGGANFFLVYGISIPLLNPFGTYSLPIYIIVVAYAILKYRLMDITIALTRAGIFAVVYTFVLGIPFLLGYRYGLWQPATWTAIFLATLGPFIYIYIDRRAEERLLKEQRRYQETLKQAAEGMTRIRDLKKLLNLIVHIITKAVRISYGAIYLHDKEIDAYLLQISRDKSRSGISKLSSDNPLIQWIISRHASLVYEEVKRKAQDTDDVTYKQLEENMRLLFASVIIPSFLENRLLGFLVLGDKRSGQIYTQEDLNTLSVLASQAALAIENAQFIQEARNLQDQIALAEKMATIGTMADGLSHQINNRFYALSLIAADTIDTIKMTDASNCSPEMQEMLKQINHALSRIQENVIQGGQVVRGMLKYTRKGDEGFEPLTLDQILDPTLDMVQYKVNLSEIDIIRNYPKDHPKIRGNSVQLQEAFFNFIDNGYDSTVERKTILKEPNYHGRLTFSAQAQENGMLLITIEDNGMGIKDQDKKKLFTPFFTTKVSSRLGTGLGLYVLRRVIEEFHKGKIWFESEYGKGTRFFLQLPIAKE